MQAISLLVALCVSVITLRPTPARAMISVSEEREMGQKLIRTVLPQVQLVKDPEVQQFVERIGRNILNVIPDKYFHFRFFVIEDPALNAFAMPGGLVFVHSGLIEAIDSENELACVLAHEFGHVQGRHIARRMENMKYVNIGTAVLAIAGLFLGGGQVGSALLTGSMALNQSIGLGYSRADEQEADRRAVQWICKAGYDPRGLKTTLEKMMKNNWLGSPAIPKYLLTHPGPEERITYIDDLWKSHPCYERHKENLFTLHRIQVKLKVMATPSAEAIEMYRGILKKKPENLMATYGYALSLDKARRFNEALEVFARISKLAPDPTAFHLDEAKTLFHSGRYKETIKLLTAYLEKRPSDVSGKYFLARAYLETGRAKKALPYFKSLKRLMPEWDDMPEFLLQLGRCYTVLHRPGFAHYYLFRYYSLTGNIRIAEYHKKKALAVLPKDSEPYQRLTKEKVSLLGTVHLFCCRALEVQKVRLRALRLASTVPREGLQFQDLHERSG